MSMSYPNQSFAHLLNQPTIIRLLTTHVSIAIFEGWSDQRHFSALLGTYRVVYKRRDNRQHTIGKFLSCHAFVSGELFNNTKSDCYIHEMYLQRFEVSPPIFFIHYVFHLDARTVKRNRGIDAKYGRCRFLKLFLFCMVDLLATSRFKQQTIQIWYFLPRARQYSWS